MRSDGSNLNALPDLFIMNMIEVLQTSSVKPFTNRMKQFADNHEFKRFKKGTNGLSFNTMDAMYTYVISVYTENVDHWYLARFVAIQA